MECLLCSNERWAISIKVVGKSAWSIIVALLAVSLISKSERVPWRSIITTVSTINPSNHARPTKVFRSVESSRSLCGSSLWRVTARVKKKEIEGQRVWRREGVIKWAREWGYMIEGSKKCREMKIVEVRFPRESHRSHVLHSRWMFALRLVKIDWWDIMFPARFYQRSSCYTNSHYLTTNTNSNVFSHWSSRKIIVFPQWIASIKCEIRLCPASTSLAYHFDR